MILVRRPCIFCKQIMELDRNHANDLICWNCELKLEEGRVDGEMLKDENEPIKEN